MVEIEVEAKDKRHGVIPLIQFDNRISTGFEEARTLFQPVNNLGKGAPGHDEEELPR